MSDDNDDEQHNAEERIIHRGLVAWSRVEEDFTYHNWMDIAEALDVGRVQCMREANTNQPRGRPYNEAFSRWLKTHTMVKDGRTVTFATVDQGTRSRLNDCWINRIEIEKWRATLALSERAKINHPNAVYRKWHASRADKAVASKVRGDAVKRENVRLQEEIERMRRNGGEVISPKDSANDIACYLFEVLSESKFDQVLRIGKDLQGKHAELMREGRSEAKAKVLRGAVQSE